MNRKNTCQQKPCHPYPGVHQPLSPHRNQPGCCTYKKRNILPYVEPVQRLGNVDVCVGLDGLTQGEAGRQNLIDQCGGVEE
jgi:hypothetical protein